MALEFACSARRNSLAATVRLRATKLAEKPFKDYWANTAHPAIKNDFDRLLQTTPKRIAEKQQKQKVEKKEKDKANGGCNGAPEK